VLCETKTKAGGFSFEDEDVRMCQLASKAKRKIGASIAQKSARPMFK